MAAAVRDGFGADAAGEDRFDCTLGVLCVINVLAGNRPGLRARRSVDRRWEGWVLGQTAQPRSSGCAALPRGALLQPSISSAARESACTPIPMQDSSGA